MIYGRSVHDLRWKKKKMTNLGAKHESVGKCIFLQSEGETRSIKISAGMTRSFYDGSITTPTLPPKKDIIFFATGTGGQVGVINRAMKMPLRGASLPFEVRTEPPTLKEINFMCAT